MNQPIPLDPDEFDEYVLQQLIQTKHPEIQIARVRVVDAALTSEEGQRVSTARRVGVEVDYGHGSPSGLPQRLIVKIARPEFGDLPLYDNEVNVYVRLGERLPVITPRCVGGYHHEASGTFGLVLEDLRPHGVQFESVRSTVTVSDVEKLLDQLARLHAAYWQSPRFTDDLAWVLPHTSGPIHDLFTDPAGTPALIDYEVATQQFKRELVESIEETTDSLREKVAKAQSHQASLAQTLVHGDAHIGNTYLNGDGSRGLLDWQLAARGYCMHDVTYTIVSGLSIKDRRVHERHLIQYYRDRLTHAGVADPPSLQQLLHEHRIAAAWCLYIGWLTTPLDNYGWEITIANHIRLATAYRDLNTQQAIDGLPTETATS